MPLDYYVNCPIESCKFHRAPIRLLVANPQQTIGDLAEWPEDGTFLYLACPECRRVFVHCHAYQDDFPEESHNVEKAWLRISFRCAKENCRTPIEFHVLLETTVTQTTESELRTKLRTEHWTGVSPCDHPISTANILEFLFDFVRGKMRGYNPRHPRWNALK